MNTPWKMRLETLEQLVRFLEEHPGFSPLLEGEDAVVYGFQTGDCFLTLSEMEQLIGAEPRFDAQQTALLLAPTVRPR